MRFLHTSDWHIGRTFHSHSTLDALETVLEALVGEATARGADAVLVAGDVFDSSVPSADAIALFERVLRRLRDEGIAIVVSSGNHDSATRLGMHADWLRESGIHLHTRIDRLDVPTTFTDAHGPVHVYGLPYLEPALLRAEHPEAALRTQEDAVRFAMDRVRRDRARRGGRSVVLAHCFAAGVAAADAASDVERDITAGGLQVVSASVFDGVDYAALGHIHGRSTPTPRVRYSGAPLHYSFDEAGKPRGGWVVDLDAAGLAAVEPFELPVPRGLVELEGDLETLLAAPGPHAASWVKAIATDGVRPIDAMRRLQTVFPHCVAFEWRPTDRAAGEPDVRSRAAGRSDAEIVAGFLEHVRNGHGPDDFEAALIAELLQDRAAAASA